MATKTPHIGSSFDDWLNEEGIRDEVDAAVAKRMFAQELAAAMEVADVSVSELARRMKTSRPAVLRLLDRDNPAATLDTLTRAAAALGRRVHITMEPLRTRTSRPAAKRVTTTNRRAAGKAR